MSTKQEAYDLTLAALQKEGLSLLESYDEFVGQKHKVKCLSCGREFFVYYQKKSIIGRCPNCSNDEFYVKKRLSFNKVKDKLDSLSLELLDDIQNYSLKNLHLRCKYCGNVYSRAYHSQHMIGCPKCSEGSRHGNRVLKLREFYKTLNLDLVDVISNTQVSVRCVDCGKIYYVYPSTESAKICGCKIGVSGLVNKDLLSKLKLLQDNGYSLKELGSNSTNTKVLCSNGHELTLSSIKFLNGGFSKCSLCLRDELHKKFLEECSNKNLTLLSSEFKGFQDNGKKQYYLVRCNNCGLEYETLAKQVYLCPRCRDRSQFRSFREIEISNYLESKGLIVYKSYKPGLKFDHNSIPFEIDIYLPEYKLGIEFNGYYWHSIKMHPKDYHKQKTEKCLSAGIKLIHLWEDCPTGLCKSIIMAKLGQLRTVYARDLQLVEDLNVRSFFDYNHVDGYTLSFKSFSLVDSDGVIMCALSLRRNGSCYEIARFANKRGVVVVGGYSRLLSRVRKFMIETSVKNLISYCNRDLSPDPNNTFYSKYGFKFLGETSLIMKYYVNKSVEIGGTLFKAGIYSRQHFQKHILVEECKKRGIECEGIGEVELAKTFDIYAVYNSGNFKYLLSV